MSCILLGDEWPEPDVTEVICQMGLLLQLDEVGLHSHCSPFSVTTPICSARVSNKGQCVRDSRGGVSNEGQQPELGLTISGKG